MTSYSSSYIPSSNVSLTDINDTLGTSNLSLCELNDATFLANNINAMSLCKPWMGQRAR